MQKRISSLLWTQYKQSGLLSLTILSDLHFAYLEIPSLTSNKTKGKKEHFTKGKKEHYTLLHCKMFKLPYAFHMHEPPVPSSFTPQTCHATTDSTVTAHYITSKLTDMPNHTSISHFRCWWASDWGPLPHQSLTQCAVLHLKVKHP